MNKNSLFGKKIIATESFCFLNRVSSVRGNQYAIRYTANRAIIIPVMITGFGITA